ncbi:zinc finger protein Dzip1 isoform X1 [Anguilla anguilla]|uniref:zinc finger protein Dzip1 isoform X1 n=1 Tax=Anguilla anguilla TaxID=7936 RepID=UPI0015B332FD|nr:zinc finger protein Dzip1 isoform X1 [Anguilla anguilla]XP_035249875.1 zinc finger protein Dzip1 isoform X1 [Anguilla anguilla]XP_035249876.1 zinc finger protein Dzip1 isoform X1 [Anguilla anguilla]
MPFHNSVYYPYQSEPPGGQSSAGIPSLLNSPQSQRSSSSGLAPGASAMSGAPPVPVFKFRPRRESVDWRRISAVDVDRVASELDFQTLQEHVMGVTFCSVEHERCPHCQNPVDPVLLKLFRLAQLTVEYLLHSQDYLTHSLQAAEEKLQAAALEKEQLHAQLQKQVQDTKGLKDELKQRKKIIVSQQSMINAGMGGYHKCQCCDKAFMNSSFLQSHMQRRHPEEYDIRLMSEKQRKVQAVKLQEEINKLKEQLSLTRSQLEVQQQAHTLKASQEQEQQSKEEDMLKRLERWKEEERERQSRQMEEMREIFLKESKELKTELQQYKSQVNLLSEMEESSRKMRSLQEEKLQASSEERHRDDVRKLQLLLKKQDEKWASRLQKSQEEHERERSKLQGDLRRLRGVTEEQEASRRRLEEMSWKLQEQRELLASQREQMSQFTSNLPVRVAEPTVIVTAPEPKPKPPVTVQIEQPKSVGKLDPITELSEEEKDSSSISEKKTAVKKQPPISALKKNPNLKRELRSALEQTLTEKLESLGVKEGVSRLTKDEHVAVLAKLRSERERRAKMFPEYRSLREDLSHSLTLRARERDRESSSAPEQPGPPRRSPDEGAQVRSRSSSLPSRVTQVVSKPGPSWPQQPPQQPPQPAPRSKNSTLPKSSTPRTAEVSSDEESEEEEGPSLRRGGPQGHSAEAKDAAQSVMATAASAESDSEWSEGSVMEEIDLRQLQRYGGQNGIMGKASQGNLVKDLSRSLERQLQDRSQRRPAGGVGLLPGNKEAAVREAVQELKYTEIDEDDDDDWDISSLEDKPSLPKQDSVVMVKKSLDSSNTSVWGTSTGKGQEGGLQKGGTSSTLKSSLVTVSDWSDDDI